MPPQELQGEVAKLAPPAVVSTVTILGIPLSEWVYIATIGYIIVQCSLAIYKTIKQVRRDKERP